MLPLGTDGRAGGEICLENYRQCSIFHTHLGGERQATAQLGGEVLSGCAEAQWLISASLTSYFEVARRRYAFLVPRTTGMFMDHLHTRFRTGRALLSIKGGFSAFQQGGGPRTLWACAPAPVERLHVGFHATQMRYEPTPTLPIGQFASRGTRNGRTHHPHIESPVDIRTDLRPFARSLVYRLHLETCYRHSKHYTRETLTRVWVEETSVPRYSSSDL